MSTPLSIMLDPAQDRLSADALSTLVSGRDWDPTYSSNVWIDPVTNTLMLEPAPVNPAWTTSTTGIYGKYGLSDFGLSSPWLSHLPDTGGGFMFYNAPNTSGLAAVGPTLGVNQPICLEYFTGKVTSGSYEVLRFGWSNTHDSTAGVAVRIYADGSTEVWKGGYLVGSYSGGGSSPNYFDQALAQSRMLGGGSTPALPAGYQKVMLIPCRDRELLVVSSGGASFCHVFQDLAEGTSGLTITPGESLWFYVVAPVAIHLRFAKLQFASTGTASGIQSNWRHTPPSGSPAFDVFQSLSQAGAGLVTPAVVTPATNPYSVANPIQIQLSLTAGSAPNWTPFVYGARAYFSATTEQTATPSGGPVELLPYTTAFHLDVSDTIGGTRATVTLKQPSAISETGGAEIVSQCHRAMQIYDEHGMIVNGITEPPHWSDSFGFDSGGIGYDQNQEIEFEVRDMWKLAEEYIFSDPIPLDGLTLSAAYTLVASMIGIPSALVYVSSSAGSFVLPFTAASGGDWAFLCDVGDKGSEILDRLHQTYAANWFHGFRPSATSGSPPVLSLIDPADSSSNGLPSTATVELYEALAAAASAGKGWRQVYRSYRTQYLEPEANDLWVMGRDPRGGKPIVAHKADTASQAVTTAPSSRPSNWLGSIRKYAWVDPSITTIGAAEYAMGVLFPRLTPVREIVEFESEYLPGVWRGDLVTLHRASGDPVTVRIKTFSGSFEYVGTFGDSETPDGMWRPCRYVGETGPLVCPLDVYGTSARAIAANWNTLKALSKLRVYEGGEVIARRPILNQQEV